MAMNQLQWMHAPLFSEHRNFVISIKSNRRIKWLTKHRKEGREGIREQIKG